MKEVFTSIIFLSGLLHSLNVTATHIRAGEIIVERISVQSLRYRISVIAYTDTASPIEFGGGILQFGDGTEVRLDRGADFQETIDLGGDVAYNIFVLEHTFPATGEFTIRYTEPNRNPLILNMANSIGTRFYIETTILIDPFLGLNSTPVLLVPPIDDAATGAAFFHNPGAFDPDGDSLAYKIVLPKQERDLEVFDYTFPNDPRHYAGLNYATANEARDAPPTYTLDEITGDMVWDAPGLAGEYNVAFIVEEWRNVNGTWQLIGSVTRDMQIIVIETENNRPELAIPKDTCIVAGTLLESTITGQDPDGHDVILESFSGVYNLQSSPAQFSPDPTVAQPTPGQLDFSWQTNCSHVRERPYQIQFKVTDAPPPLERPALVNFETWNVTVIAPAPEGLTATARPGREIQLNWDRYACGNAEEMRIYRRVDSFNYEPGHCMTGIPENGGYELIGTTEIGIRSFTDDNNRAGLNPGATYCYRLVAVFPLPAGGESIVSEEVCVTLKADAPLITNVSVENTGVDNGEILIRWTSPFEIDTLDFPPPFRYEVVRAVGFNGNGTPTVVASTTDTVFYDSSLNTREQVFSYKIYLYDASNLLIDSSAMASSVRLSLTPSMGGIRLDWEANVPWSNNVMDFPYHYIYRDNIPGNNPDELMLIDSVNVNENGFSYSDDGSFNNMPLSNEVEYCYYIVTRGRYGLQAIPRPLLNKSQVNCAQPADTIPPCAPISLTIKTCSDFIENEPCRSDNYVNNLFWSPDRSLECGNDISSYNIYFSEVFDGEHQLIGNTVDTFFVHDGSNGFIALDKLGGSYQVTAVDGIGNESQTSIRAMADDFDNCVYYELPNVFTPNGDGLNDTFEAFKDVVGKCPRFVNEVKFTVFNRWGKKLFDYQSGGENEIFIDWNGNSDLGSQLASGIYYYEADVTFDVYDNSFAKRKLNGWIHLVR